MMADEIAGATGTVPGPAAMLPDGPDGPEGAVSDATGSALDAVVAEAGQAGVAASSGDKPMTSGAGHGPQALRAGEGPDLARPLSVLQGVEMLLTAELGRTRMLVRELLNLRIGSIVELDRQVGSDVDVLVNGTPFAKGEVVVVDEELGIRITELAGEQPATGGQ